jgi:cell volume regulation protein A
MQAGEFILVAGVLLAGGLLASLVAARLRVPGLILFLALGMAIGSDGTGWIDFGGNRGDYELAEVIGIVALALILFEGGLAAGLEEIRPVLGPALGLAVLGTLITAVIAGLAASWLLDLPTLEGMLIGSIVAATDGAAIFAVLRGSTLRRRVARVLEGEAGMNDPVAVLLVLGFIEWILHPGYGIADMALLLARQLGIGLAAGVLVGWLGVQAFQRVRLATPGLYPVASIAVAALAFGGADVLGGSGFLAVYLAGLALGTPVIPAKQTVTTFHQGFAWVAQISLFLALGLLVFPGQLDDVALEGTLLALVLMFVARPIAATVATLGARFSIVERLAISWAGLRGGVPVVLALFPVIDEVPGSLTYFDIVFFAVLLSTILQGTTFEPVARLLGVTTSEPALPRPLAETGTIRRLGAEVVEFTVRPEDAIVGLRVRELGLPREALVSVIVRGEEAVLPRGSSRIEAGDQLHVVVRQEAAGEFPRLLERWRTGPVKDDRVRPALPSYVVSFTVRPHEKADGDPARPKEIAGQAVVERLRTRRDVPGALIVLADGRHAVTGPLIAVGSPEALQTFARRRLHLAGDDEERAWWQEVIGTLATPWAAR